MEEDIENVEQWFEVYYRDGKFHAFGVVIDVSGYNVGKYMAGYDNDSEPCVFFSVDNIIHSWQILHQVRRQVRCVSRVVQFCVSTRGIAYMVESRMVYRFDMNNPSRHEVMGKADILQYDGLVIRENMYWSDVLSTTGSIPTVSPVALQGIDSSGILGWEGDRIFVFSGVISNVNLPDGTPAVEHSHYDVINLQLSVDVIGTHIVQATSGGRLHVYTRDGWMHEYDIMTSGDKLTLTHLGKVHGIMSILISDTIGSTVRISNGEAYVRLDDAIKSCLYQTG